MLIPKDLYYTQNHLWLRKIGQYDFYIGLTDFGQSETGQISLIEIVHEGNSVKKGKTWGKIFGANLIFDLVSPFDLKILGVNPELDEKISYLNSDPYSYWLAVVTIKQDNAELLSDKEYKVFIK